MNQSQKKQLDDQQIETLINQYRDSIDRLTLLVRAIVEKLEVKLKQKGILARVTGRVKSKDSLSGKLGKWASNDEKYDHKIRGLGQDRGLLRTVGDLAAVRVMTYLEEDRKTVAQIARQIFTHAKDQPDFDFEEKENVEPIKDNPNNFYRASHMQIKLKKEDCIGPYANVENDHCELQITSMLAHVWNEIEHDIVYKGEKDEVSPAEIAALESLGMLTKAGDNIISNLIEANKRRTEHQYWASKSLTERKMLVNFLEEHFGGMRFGKSKIDYDQNSSGVFDALLDLEMLHPEEITKFYTPKHLCNAFDLSRELSAFMKREGVSRNLVEPNSCDIFFVALLPKYVHSLLERGHRHKGRRGMTFARHYKNMIARKRTPKTES